MKDLKITAFCTTESVPEHLKPLLAEIEVRDHHPVLRLRISYSWSLEGKVILDLCLSGALYFEDFRRTARNLLSQLPGCVGDHKIDWNSEIERKVSDQLPVIYQIAYSNSILTWGYLWGLGAGGHLHGRHSASDASFSYPTLYPNDINLIQLWSM